MGKLIEVLLEEIEDTIDHLEMYQDLGCSTPDALMKQYNDIMDDSLVLRLTRERQSAEDGIQMQIRKMKYIRAKLLKLEETI